MDPASIVQDTESTRFWSQTDGQTHRQMNEAKPLYPTSNFDASECMTKLALLLLSKNIIVALGKYRETCSH